MALPLRTGIIPQCTACIRSYTRPILSEHAPVRHQVRGKKTATKASPTIPARLLKDLSGYGRKGAIVPMTRGEMRNRFFPSRIAEYVTISEQRMLRAQDVTIERDYAFGRKEDPIAPEPASTGPAEPLPLPRRRAPEVDKLSIERSLELLEIFVGHRLDFYRQPMLEERVVEEPVSEQSKREERRQGSASSAAADLLASRSQAPAEKTSKPTGAIYGSVSTHDILVAVRAAIATNDEAARVVLTEQDIHFLDEAASKEGKLKLVGDFTIELRLKGSDVPVRRTVRVIPQES